MDTVNEVTVVTPVGCIGNRGVDLEALQRAMEEENPDVLAVDAGSLDCGPWYLGAGKAHSPRANIKWDLEAIVSQVVRRGVPVIIGTAGGSGARRHVDNTVQLVREIAGREGIHFRLGVIYSDVDQSYLMEKLGKVRVESLADGTALGRESVERSSTIVAAMGIEPIMCALEKGADVIIAGRAVDSAVIAAYPVWRGFDRGLAYHMGDIMECAESAAEERYPILRSLTHNRIPIVGRLRQDHFLLRPSHEGMTCTPLSCQLHALYERSDMSHFAVPGGVVDKTRCVYEQVDQRTTKVSETGFLSEPYTVVLEGVRKVGYRTLLPFGVRTPEMIGRLNEILEDVAKTENAAFAAHGNFDIHFHVYGRNGVLQEYEYVQTPCHEVGVIVDVVGESQELTHDVADDILSRLAFYRYPGRYTTAGNIAVTFSPAVFDGGEVFTLEIFHRLPLEDPCEPFETSITSI